MKTFRINILFLLFIVITAQSILFSQGFLHRQDKKIVNGSGQEVKLKGIGLGGWLLQEGYMLHTSDFANAQWQIQEKILDLVGELNTELFYQTYRNSYVKKADIDSIKSWGFNSIRLPFHYNLYATNTNPPTFLTLGFEIVDSLLQWCKQNEIYLILDMHAAPGGQSAEPISDYNPANLSLWESESNKTLTVQIWRKIAERYKDEVWIGGYDLLNEPAWNLPPNNQPLHDLYVRITDTIRTVDNNHLLFIEGNWFATEFVGLTSPWDENMSYSFHKYWNSNAQSSIQYLVDLRNNTNRPLWLGETGENSNKWFTDCAKLMATNNIGWAWWPHKKIQSIAGPLSAYLLPVYQNLLNYWNGSAPRPSATVAMNALMAQVNMLLIENCAYQKDVIDALIRQPSSTEIIPFAENQVPGIVQATNYDLGQIQFAYNDTEYENVGGGNWNNGYSYRNDGVDIEACSDFSSNGFNVGWIETGEWLKYTFNATQSGLYDINLNVAAPNTGGKIILSLDGQSITGLLDLPATGGWQNWQYLSTPDIYLSAGNHVLQTRFFFGGFNFSYMDFVLTTVNAETEIKNPNTYSLQQNFPNPFNPSTTITFSTKEFGNVQIDVFDMLGREIINLVNSELPAGMHSVDFEGTGLSSGIYYYILKAGDFTTSRKMILLK
ncbi:MAG: cellulase family glycosylhydrolase [Ignavibacteriota bacterium]